MKILLAIVCSFFVATLATPLLQKKEAYKLGAKECTWGPTYWCSNLTNAKSCGAVKHCIQTVWEKQTLPVDNDSICKICLDMVAQARDQLESNETISDIKAVFEGSCDLLPLKPVKKTCKKLADEFILELVDTLASEMNPNVVCSTAGLCNNVEIDEMLAEYEAQQKTQPKSNLFSCEECNTIGSTIANKFQTSNRDQVLDGILAVCGQFSSFSDACTSLVLTHFNAIYAEMKSSLKAENICHMSGVCSAQFHQHEEEIEIETKSNNGFVNKPEGDDIPCELCEQLVNHLKDLLVANTTELEFKMVMEGFCKQAHGFKDECLSIVDQYYPEIYSYLVKNLDSNGACFMIGVCPKGSNHPLIAPSAPLVPIAQMPPKLKLGENEEVFTAAETQAFQLPIDQLMGAPQSLQLEGNGQWCTLCDYVLHFVQEALSEEKNEDEIKKAVAATCDSLPRSISGNCRNFVDLYGDAVIALLVQEIDPSDVCPRLKLCPKSVKDVDLFAPVQIDVSVNEQKEENKPKCPLCVLIIKQVQDIIDSSNSKTTVKQALDKVCYMLPVKLQLECIDFIESYSGELIDKLVTNFSPKELCGSLKLCSVAEQDDMDVIRVGIEKLDQIPYVTGDIMTNEIPDDTYNGQPISFQEMVFENNAECLMCQEAFKDVERKMINNKSRKQIEALLVKECARVKKYAAQCEQYVDQNADRIIDLIMKDMTPKQICHELKVCSKGFIGVFPDSSSSSEEDRDLDIDEALEVMVVAVPSAPVRVKLEKTVELSTGKPKSVKDTPQCVMCEFIMTKLEAELKDKTTEEEIKHTVENICHTMPKSVSKACVNFVDQYADLIISLLDSVPPKQICVQMGLCNAVQLTPKAQKVGAKECTWGPSHWCGDEKVAAMCGATAFCKERKMGKWNL